MTRVKLIVNPVAGRGEAAVRIPEVEGYLNALGIDYDMDLTQRPWHAAELAKEAAAGGYTVVAAMGGDGTANEVLNGLMTAREAGHTQAALAILGAGRGNDFAFGAGIPHDLERDCRLLKEGIRHPIDVGRVRVDGKETRYFGNGVGIGFDAVVGFEAAKHKRLTGFLSYLVAGLKTLLIYYKAPLCRIESPEGAVEEAALMISVMNGRRMGGGFMMAPEGRPDDGVFDVCRVRMAARPRLLLLMADFIRGTQVGRKPVTLVRLPNLTVTAISGSLPAHADGETLCTEGQRLEIDVLPAGLDIMIGPERL